MASIWFKVKELADSVLMIQEPLRRLAPDYLTNTMNTFIVYDKKEALLIDCGTGVYSINDIVLSILGNRTIVTPFITHNHWDHVGSLYEFDSALIHEKEITKLLKDEDLDIIREDVIERNDPVGTDIENPFIRRQYSGEAIHVKDGEWIQVGKRELQILHLPGHTEGSIGLWYPDEKFLFVGDAYQAGYVYSDENPKDFFKTLEKLNELKVGTYFMPAHEEIFLQSKDLEELEKMFVELETGSEKLIHIKNRYLDNKLMKGEKFSIILPKTY